MAPEAELHVVHAVERDGLRGAEALRGMLVQKPAELAGHPVGGRLRIDAGGHDLADEETIHYGLVPRTNRGIFAINELPDLQARIQVALFNILQEGDVQIRGFKLRIPLDIQFIFTANPEDYTNRGSIVTPLKDRIQSQILTHYPKTLETRNKTSEPTK